MLRKDGIFICAGALFTQFAVFGIHNNFGLFFDSLYKEFELDASQIGMHIKFRNVHNIFSAD